MDLKAPNLLLILLVAPSSPYLFCQSSKSKEKKLALVAVLIVHLHNQLWAAGECNYLVVLNFSHTPDQNTKNSLTVASHPKEFEGTKPPHHMHVGLTALLTTMLKSSKQMLQTPWNLRAQQTQTICRGELTLVNPDSRGKAVFSLLTAQPCQHFDNAEIPRSSFYFQKRETVDQAKPKESLCLFKQIEMLEYNSMDIKIPVGYTPPCRCK